MEKENINIRKKSYEIKKVISLSGDMLVPDTKPDIIGNVGSNGNCFIKREEVLDGKIRLEGNWCGNIIYLSDLGETKSLNNSFDFLESIDDDRIAEKDEIEYSYKVISSEVKILNERKINSLVEIEYTIIGYKFEEINMISSLEDELGVQKLEKTILTRRFILGNSTKTTINEDVNFLEPGKNVEILKSDLMIINAEKKISYNKVLAKAEANIKLLYLCENQIKVFDIKIPIMSFIEMENAKEDNIIDLNYKIRKCNLTNNIFEKGIVNCDLDFEITCSMYERKEVRVIQDMYSLEKDINYSKQEINMECITEKQNEVFEFNEKINLEGIKELYYFEYNLKKIEMTSNKNCEGALSIDVYYSKEENNSLMIKNIEVPFLIKNISSNNQKFKISFCDVRANENLCNFKIECMENIKYEAVEVLTECEFVDCSSDNNYSMIIYFVKPNDTIWKIAKDFKVSMESLIELNNLSDPDKINIGEKLYIMKG